MSKDVIFKKVFLDDLPRLKNKNNHIDWKNSVGYKVKFIYEKIDEKIEGEIEIIGYNRNNKNKNLRLLLKYKNNIKEMAMGQFTRCEIGVLLNKISYEHTYSIGTIIHNVNSGILEIKEHIRISEKRKRRAYKYVCKICGNEDIIDESNLIGNKVGCNFCAGKKVLKGVNDLWTTHPYIAKYLKYPEEGYEISHGSNKKLYFKCHECGHERKSTINDITSDGFSCTVCGDGISYPEKFVSCLLKQLTIEFERGKTFEWAKDKRYDFYIHNINCIIETHGRQHYDNGFNNIKSKFRKPREEQENDKIKELLANNNGINNYIVIDCRESNLEWIKNSILNSQLNKLFDLTTIDWNECAEFALNNLVKEVCNTWNNTFKTILEIADIYKINRSCVRNYLKQGAKLGWCDYDPKTNNRGSKSRKVICLNDKQIYNSISKASQNYNVSETTINFFCQGKIFCNEEELNGTYLQWQFYDEYLKNPRQLLTKIEIDNIKLHNMYRKKVICLNNNKMFEFIKDATEYANLKTSSSICSCCRGKTKYAGKHPETGEPLIWMYYEDYLKEVV